MWRFNQEWPLICADTVVEQIICVIYCCKMYMYLIRTFKTALLLWTLGKCTLIWAASKRSIFAILVLITRFISRSSKCFPIRTAPIPKKIILISSFFCLKFFSISCVLINALVYACTTRPGHSLEEKIKIVS